MTLYAMRKEMQQAFKIGLLLAVVCVCLVGFTPSTYAQSEKTEKGANGYERSNKL